MMLPSLHTSSSFYNAYLIHWVPFPDLSPKIASKGQIYQSCAPAHQHIASTHDPSPHPPFRIPSSWRRWRVRIQVGLAQRWELRFVTRTGVAKSWTIKLNMEQKQNQEVPVEGSRHQHEWENAKNEFAEEGELIEQTDDAVKLVEKWLWIQHEQEFKEYEKQLQEKDEIGRNLQSIIAELIQEEKQGAWMINQRYTRQQVTQIISKLRLKVRQILKYDSNLNPEPKDNAQNNTQQEANIVSQQATRQKQHEAAQKEMQANYSCLLPQIKPKGKLYSPQQMHTSFHLLKETEEEYKIKSPYMFAEDKGTKQIHKQGIFNNKYLKQTFKWLCKQGYNYRGLFEDFSKEGDKMTLNKWMVFCKEFDFTNKIHKKDLVSIYQTATKFTSFMTLQDFLTAVALLQEKYVSKFHKGDGNFVADILQIDSEASFKVKMDNLKVNYSGPRKNFFELATYSEHERIDEIQREKQFQQKRHQRQIVLIKGMFEDHLKDELQQLKTNRERMKVSRLGQSLNMIQIKQKSNEKPSPLKTTRPQALNYSKIFQINRGVPNESHSTATNTNSSDKKMYRTELTKVDNKSHKIEHKRIDAQSKKSEENNKKIPEDHKGSSKAIKIHKEPIQKPIEQEQPQRTWLTNVRSDSQESDDILKEHLEFEKRVKETKVDTLMKEMREQSKQVDKIKKLIQEENAQDQDLLETGVNFKKDRQVFP